MAGEFSQGGSGYDLGEEELDMYGNGRLPNEQALPSGMTEEFLEPLQQLDQRHQQQQQTRIIPRQPHPPGVHVGSALPVAPAPTRRGDSSAALHEQPTHPLQAVVQIAAQRAYATGRREGEAYGFGLGFDTAASHAALVMREMLDSRPQTDAPDTTRNLSQVPANTPHSQGLATSRDRDNEIESRSAPVNPSSTATRSTAGHSLPPTAVSAGAHLAASPNPGTTSATDPIRSDCRYGCQFPGCEDQSWDRKKDTSKSGSGKRTQSCAEVHMRGTHGLGDDWESMVSRLPRKPRLGTGTGTRAQAPARSTASTAPPPKRRKTSAAVSDQSSRSNTGATHVSSTGVNPQTTSESGYPAGNAGHDQTTGSTPGSLATLAGTESTTFTGVGVQAGMIASSALRFASQTTSPSNQHFQHHRSGQLRGPVNPQQVHPAPNRMQANAVTLGSQIGSIGSMDQMLQDDNHRQSVGPLDHPVFLDSMFGTQQQLQYQYMPQNTNPSNIASDTGIAENMDRYFQHQIAQDSTYTLFPAARVQTQQDTSQYSMRVDPRVVTTTSRNLANYNENEASGNDPGGSPPAVSPQATNSRPLQTPGMQDAPVEDPMPEVDFTLEDLQLNFSVPPVPAGSPAVAQESHVDEAAMSTEVQEDNAHQPDDGSDDSIDRTLKPKKIDKDLQILFEGHLYDDPFDDNAPFE